MSALVADQLSFGWSPDTLLFENISFSIDAERVGLVGQNGIGKTALINLLTGELDPLGGVIRRPERWTYLTQLTDRSMTIAQALGIDRKLAALSRLAKGAPRPEDYDLVEQAWDIEERAEAALREAGVPERAWSAPLSTLSGGQAMRVKLARIELEQPELLILDEPTNDLDADGLSRLYRLIDTWTQGLLVVSHDRSLLSIVDRILELSSLGLKSYGGGYELYHEAKSTERAAAAHRLLDAERQLRQSRREAQDRKERADRRAAQGKRSKTGSLPPMVLGALKRQAQVTSGKLNALGTQQIIDARERVKTAKADIEHRDPLDFDMASTGLSARKQVLLIDQLGVQIDRAQGPIIRAFDLKVVGPERIAIKGNNGTGKTTLLRAIYGELAAYEGAVRIGVDRIAFLKQDLRAFDSDRSLIAYFTDQNPDLSDNHARAALARFGFRNVSVDKQLRQLSGGERLRAALAAELYASTPPELLILDEPTNHMGLESIETLEAALNAYDGALLVVSHDPWFLNAIGIDREIHL